jgi:HD-like signal output (HDOD) protein
VQIAHADYTIYRQVVSQLLNGEEKLPSLPTITMDIRRALEQPNISLAKISQLIAKDPSLSAILVKYASSALFHVERPPQTLLDVVRILGMNQLERVTMVHSVNSLFAVHSPQHKRLFVEAWNRIALKASIGTHLAKTLHKINPDRALLGCLLSEIGTLAILSAFKKHDQIPSLEIYIDLCREYAKSLGVVMLKRWRVDEEYIDLIRKTGNWADGADQPFGLNDIVNLALYHSVKMKKKNPELPPISTLSAYQKLTTPHNLLSDNGSLLVVVNQVQEIKDIARTLFRV